MTELLRGPVVSGRLACLDLSGQR